jgi:hypothetical protein
MGYALFSQDKLVIQTQLNATQLQQTQRMDEQTRLATNKGDMEQMLSNYEMSKSEDLADLYDELVGAQNDQQRNQIQAEIQQFNLELEQETQEVQNDIYEISRKENIIEREVQHLNTLSEVYQQQLEAIKSAESAGIKNSIPKFSG